MDKEKFLKSGLLQQYAFGLTDEEESAIVEEYLRAYPDIRRELNDLHEALNSYSEELNLPKRNTKDWLPPSATENEKISEITGKNSLPKRRSRRWAIWLFFLGVAISGCIYFYSRSLNFKHRLETAEAEIAQIRERFQDEQQEHKPLLSNLHFIQQAHTQQYRISPLHSKVGEAVLYWNPLEEKAMIQLVDYRSHMEVGDIFLWDFGPSEQNRIIQLKKVAAKLQAVPFFPEFHQLRITGENPSDYIVTGGGETLAQ